MAQGGHGGSLLNAAPYMGTHKVNETVPLRFFTIAELTKRQAGAALIIGGGERDVGGYRQVHQIFVFVG